MNYQTFLPVGKRLTDKQEDNVEQMVKNGWNRRDAEKEQLRDALDNPWPASSDR